ncbi:MAG: 3'-5' exonuclease [Phycisphaerales bacterium]|nr:3'-5' exonuclease [Phycisphaerales bacterium]
MTNEQLKNILFIDIETATIRPHWNELSETMQQLWIKKAKTLKPDFYEDADLEKLFEEKGGVFSEFSKVVCIGVGSFVQQEKHWFFRLKSLTEIDEKVLLKNFCALLLRFSTTNKGLKFCGHNIKEFDLPFLCRRMIINGIPLPNSLQLSNKKPWEITHMDTLELWKFGDYKNYTSLALLAEVLGIPSPKDDMDGSMVGKVFWEEQNADRIATYCLKDVWTTAQVFLQLIGINDIHPQPIYL